MKDWTGGDVREYIAQQRIEVMAKYGKGYNCVLVYTIGGDLYEVIDHGDIAYRGTNAQQAVDTFYDIPAR